MKTIILWLLFLVSLHAGTGEKIIDAARKQIGVTVTYDPAYVSLSYPNGDLPRDRGVCTDVLIRALRDSLSVDLQKLVHEDMVSHFSVYPKQWGLSRADKNIDHRRVPNLKTYFKRRSLEVPAAPSGYFSSFLPGDIVTCTVPPNLPHVMIVSDRKTLEGRPMVIHNIGGGTREEDALARFSITGHYRWK
ncbi:MAG: DUF1287 domain-containing protein [Gloeobacteraceae cyanobacterium ES-bin-144]|nr:DUF1287 domain-containing protein [Verrucomicrobiales bacterium]